MGAGGVVASIPGLRRRRTAREIRVDWMRPFSIPVAAVFIFQLQLLCSCAFAVDFIFNSFNRSQRSSLLLVRDAHIEPPVIQLTHESNQQSAGRVFFPTPLRMRRYDSANNSSTLSSFSTSFIFSIVPEHQNLPGFGIAFVLSDSINPPGAISGQYFGLFSNTTVPFVAPLLAVEFDTGRNPEFNDPDDNHIGIDLNNIESAVTNSSGYWNSSQFIPIFMRSGENFIAWIEFSGPDTQINVTIAPAGLPRPSRPLISYKNPNIAGYIADEMFVGFSASKVSSAYGVTWVEQERILGWSLNDEGRLLQPLNTSGLPDFRPPSSSSSSRLPVGHIAAISSACVILTSLFGVGTYWVYRRRQSGDQNDDIEDWELEYWPHRFLYEELSAATGGFSQDHLLGSGGFGKVYRGILTGRNKTEIAVKCISHDSKQGLREFMAEISSMGRLQHKNLLPLRGWCRKGNELMLIYDYMPNGSLYKRIFDEPEELLGWEARRRILADVAEGLLYLHYGWDQMVLHRDVKSGNILLDSEMRGRLGDFGLAKLYQHGEAPSNTRVVGTIGYMAPELARVPAPTAASDVYSFGVVILEVATGRRPIDLTVDDDVVLVDFVRELYASGTIMEAADPRIAGQYTATEMEKTLKLGLACCHPIPELRPTMRDVATVFIGPEADRVSSP